MNFMFVLVIGFLLYQTAVSGSCYECLMCGDPWNTTFENMTVQCTGPCVKVKTSSDVRRFCSQTSQSEGCVDISYLGVTTRHCVCYGQLCNRATVDRAHATMIVYVIFTLRAIKLFI